MSIRDSIADIERDVGALTTFLEAGEYDEQDLRLRHEGLKETIEELGELRSQNEDWLDNNSEGTRKYDLVSEQTGAMEDAEFALSSAEDELQSALKLKDPAQARAIQEAICCLERASQYLMEAAGVNV